MGKLSGSSYFLLGWECASSEVWKQKNFAKLDLLSSSWLIDALPYLFFKGSTCCKSMQVPFCQRFCDWLPVLKEDVFFPKTVPYIIFSNGCWLHIPAIKGYIAHPFVFQMFVFSQAVCHNLFFKGCRQPFFAKAAGNLFCKGCGLPFPHLLPFFQRFYFSWNLPQSFFPKEPPFFPKVAIFAQVLIYCFLDQFGP